MPCQAGSARDLCVWGGRAGRRFATPLFSSPSPLLNPLPPLSQIEADAGGAPDPEARAALDRLKAVLAAADAAGVATADEDGAGGSGRSAPAGPACDESDAAAEKDDVNTALAAQVDALRARLEAVENAVRGLDGPARDLVAAGLRDAGMVVVVGGGGEEEGEDEAAAAGGGGRAPG